MERVKAEVRKAITDNINKLIANTDGIKGVSDFANSIGVSRDTVNNWISGKSDIRLNDLVKIREKYGVNIDYLLGLSDTAAISEDIQTACKATGLSEKAIENARLCDPATLSALLENEMFCALLDDIKSLGKAKAQVERFYDYVREPVCETKIKLLCEEERIPHEEAQRRIVENRIVGVEQYFNIFRLEEFEIKETFASVLDMLVPKGEKYTDVKKLLREYSQQGGTDNGEQ